MNCIIINRYIVELISDIRRNLVTQWTVCLSSNVYLFASRKTYRFINYSQLNDKQRHSFRISKTGLLNTILNCLIDNHKEFTIIQRYENSLHLFTKKDPLASLHPITTANYTTESIKLPASRLISRFYAVYCLSHV